MRSEVLFAVYGTRGKPADRKESGKTDRRGKRPANAYDNKKPRMVSLRAYAPDGRVSGKEITRRL